MTTVISGDRVQRFAELDHAVLAEVRAMVETEADDGAVQWRGNTVRRAVERLLTTIRASTRLFHAS